MGFTFNPFTGNFDKVSVDTTDIGDTIGNSPTSDGYLYVDSSGTLQNNKIKQVQSSLFGGLVTINAIRDAVTSANPGFGYVDATGAGGDNAGGILFDGSGTQTFYLGVDISSVSSIGQLKYDPNTSANSNFAIALTGLTNGSQLSVTTSAADLTVPLDMNSNLINNVTDPSSAQDASTKAYTDAKVDDTAYASSWDGVTDVAPSKNAVYDKIETLGGLTGTDTRVVYFDGDDNPIGAPYMTYNDTSRILGVGDPPAFGYAGLNGGIYAYGFDKNSFVAIGHQGNVGASASVNQPHLAINTVRLYGSGGKVLSVQSNGADDATIAVNKIAASIFASKDNQVEGLAIREQFNNQGTAIGIGMTPATTPVAKTEIVPTAANISFTAAMKTLLLKAQTSQTGSVLVVEDASGNVNFEVTEDDKIGLFGVTPVARPTTAIAEATVVENAGGTPINDDSTIGGYTLGQVVQALQNLGILT